MKLPGGVVWVMVLLSVGAVGARFARDRARAALFQTTGWQSVWMIPAPYVADISLSPTGNTLAWTDRKGCVRRVDAKTGRSIWRTFPLTGVNRVVAAPNGTVAAFGALNPERNSVVLLNAATGDKNPRVWAGSGAVWSAAFDAKGAAYIGTGGQQSGIYDPKNVGLVKPRVSTGSPESLAVATKSPRLVAGSWSPTAVSGCDLTVNLPCWRREETAPGRTYRVAVSATGTRVLVLSVRGRAETKPVVRVHDGANGNVLWEAVLPEPAAYPVAKLSANGETVAVSYRRTASPSDPDDWRLAVFDARGKRFFGDKGSALFMPRLLAVSADGGTITVRSGDDTIYTLNKRGDFVDRYRLPLETGRTTPRPIVRAESTPDGTTVLLQERGDKLVLLRYGAVK